MLHSKLDGVNTWLVWGYGNFPPDAFLTCQDAPDHLLPPKVRNGAGGLLRDRWCVLVFADWQTINRKVLANNKSIMDFSLVETGVRLSKGKLLTSIIANIGKSHDKKATTEDLCDLASAGSCSSSSRSDTSGEFRWRLRGKRPKPMPPKPGSPRPLTPPSREPSRG